MNANPVHRLLQSAASRAGQRLQRAEMLVTGVCTILLGAVCGVYGYLAPRVGDVNNPDLVGLLGPLCTALGVIGGYAAPWLTWRWLKHRYYAAMRERVEENLTGRGLLLMALEPVPAAELLQVFEVPGRELGGLKNMALPQAPRALNTQRFEDRLRLLLGRYQRCCTALGLEAYPRGFMQLQRSVAGLRLLLPLACGLAICAASIFLDSPLEWALLIPLTSFIALTLRWGLGDLLRALDFAAINSVLPELLGGAPGDGSLVASALALEPAPQDFASRSQFGASRAELD